MSDLIDLFNIIIITSFIQPVGLLVELSRLISFPIVTASATS